MALLKPGVFKQLPELILSVPLELVSEGPVTVTTIAWEEFLPCEATGLPKPTIVWQKANRILTEDSLGKFCIHVKVIENKNKKVND